MKKIIFFVSVAVVSVTSCQKTKTCTCRNANGNLVSQKQLQSNKTELQIFEEECRKTRVASYQDTVLVYTPCEID